MPRQIYTSLRPQRARRGQSLVEFALILPILLLVTLGVIDAARVFTANISLTNGVREAALFAGASDLTLSGANYNKWCTDALQKAPEPAVSVPCPAGAAATNIVADPDNLAYRIDIEANGLDATKIVLAPPTCLSATHAPVLNCDLASAVYVTVTAHYPVETLTPLLSQVWGGSINLKAVTTAKLLR